MHAVLNFVHVHSVLCTWSYLYYAYQSFEKTSEKASAYLAGCLELRQNIRKATHGQILLYQPIAYNQKWPTWTKQIALLAHMQCYYSNIQWLPCVCLHGLQYSMLRWPLNPLYVTCLWNRSNCFIVLLFFIRWSFFGENSKEDLSTSLWYSITLWTRCWKLEALLMSC